MLDSHNVAVSLSIKNFLNKRYLFIKESVTTHCMIFSGARVASTLEIHVAAVLVLLMAEN